MRVFTALAYIPLQFQREKIKNKCAVNFCREIYWKKITWETKNEMGGLNQDEDGNYMKLFQNRIHEGNIFIGEVEQLSGYNTRELVQSVQVRRKLYQTIFMSVMINFSGRVTLFRSLFILYIKLEVWGGGGKILVNSSLKLNNFNLVLSVFHGRYLLRKLIFTLQ
jgi:predicted thioredoxin/glutaredoxin